MLKYYMPTLAEGSFAFQVVQQDERLTNYVQSIGGSFHAKNGWDVQISEHPQIDLKNKIIFLRGSDKSNDEFIDTHVNMDSKQAERVQKEVESALVEAVAAAKVFRVPSPRVSTVYTVPVGVLHLVTELQTCYPQNILILK